MTDLEQGSLPAWPLAVDSSRPGAQLLPPTPDVLLQAVLDTPDVGVVACDAYGRVTRTNAAADAWCASLLDGTGLYEVDGVAPLTADRLPWRRTLAEGALADVEVMVAPPGLPSRVLRCDGQVLHDDPGRVVGAVVVLTDVTALRTAQRQLRSAHDTLARTAQALTMSEDRFRSVFHHGPMAMCAVDADGGITRVNPALRRLLATSSDRLLGARVEGLVAAADRNRFAVALAASGGPELPPEPVEVRLDRADGEQVWCEAGTTRVADGVVHLLVSFADVDGRKQREAQLERRAAHDAGTGLTNRTALTVVLSELLAPGGDAAPLTLLHIEVRGLPGPDADAPALLEVASRLRGTVRPQDVVARVGGSTFVIVCQDLDGPLTRGSRALVRRLHRVLTAPTGRPAGTHRFTARIGVTQAVPGEDAGALLSRTDAGARSRTHGRDGGRPSPMPGQRPPPRARPRTVPTPARLVELVDTAVAEDRLVALYQPVVDLRTGTYVGAEALLRMRDRAGHTVMPDVFIPLAEATGAIHGMGDWVLAQSCRQVGRWKARLPVGTDFAIGVNLSPRQLDDPQLLARVEAALADTGLDPTALVLELTERLLTTSTAHVRAQLEGVRALGVHLAADDFGTGYCSVRYLLDLPLDIIKVDRSWTARLGEDSRTGRLADGVAQLVRASGLVSIVEGVETEAERAAALDRGLVLAQGYLFAEPLTADVFESRLFAG